MNKKPSLWSCLKTDLFLLVKLNLLFTLSCVPVITIPAAITAVLKICTERVRGREIDLVSDYIQYLKMSFFTSLRAVIVQSLLALLAGIVIFGGGFLLFPYSLAFLAVIGISLWAFTVSYYLFPIVERHVPLN